MPSSWIDLSVPVVTGMPVYPGDPAVEVTPAWGLSDNSRLPRDAMHAPPLP